MTIDAAKVNERIRALMASNAELVAALKDARRLLCSFESCSRNNFAHLAYEETEAIDAVLKKQERPS